MKPANERSPIVPPEAAAAEPADGAGAPDLLSSILDNTRIARDDVQVAAFEEGLFELASQLESGELPAYLTGDLPTLVNTAVASIDREISRQVDDVIHHEKFKKLESSWRNLHRLVQHTHNRSDTGDDIKIKVLNATRRELERNLGVGTKKSLFKTGLFEKIYSSAFNTWGGHPYGALIGDLEFSHEAQRDLDLLEKMAGIAAAAHAPFLAAADPKTFGFADFTEMAGTGDLSVTFNLPAYDAWRSFRRKPDARYVGLCLPHVLTRLPYGPSTGEPVESFVYEEGVDGRDHSRYLWGNAAYKFAERIVESFALSGWCDAIIGPNSGGRVEGLPLHRFKSIEGEDAVKPPTEVQLSDDREKKLWELGFIPLVHKKHDDVAAFFGAASCHDPGKFTTREAQANAFLGSQLPYIFAVSRIAHYLKLIGREKTGSDTSAEVIRDTLQAWINEYTNPQEDLPEDRRRLKPLLESRIDVLDTPGKPGHYQVEAMIRPRFKLQGMSASVSLVADIPQKGGG